MKIKKLLSIFIITMYISAICIPEVAFALENNERLDYNYWISGYNVDDHYEGVLDGKNIINEFEKEYKTILDDNISFLNDEEPEYFIQKLSEKYPDKFLTDPPSFDEYKEEYREDLINFYLEHEYTGMNLWNFGTYYDGEWSFYVDEDELLKLTDKEKEDIIKDVKDNYNDNDDDNDNDFYHKYFFNFWFYCLQYSDLEESLFESYNSEYDDFYIKAYQYKDFLTFKPEKLDKFKQAYKEDVWSEFISDSGGAYGQFNVNGLLNDSIFIGTTYEGYGYQTHLNFDGDEDYLGYVESLLDYNKNVKISKDGIELYKSGKVKLTIKAENIDDKTVKVTHILTNLKDKAVPYKLAISSDIEFGNNDNAAISKTNKSFVITQDSEETIYDYWGDEIYLSDTFGEQLNMSMSPNPTTTYVGPYDENKEEDAYKKHVYENSKRNYYTSNDDVDTALAYSWQGTLAKGETKTFTTIFGLVHTNTVDINFYPLKDDGTYGNPTDNSPISVLGGGSFKTPVSTHKVVEGYHLEWNTKKDGTGVSYATDSWVVAPNEDTNLYEVLVPNEESKKNNDNHSLIDLINPDTGDNIFLYVFAMIVCLAVLGISIHLYKKES